MNPKNIQQDLAEIETYLSGLERFGMKPGLERIEALLSRCGNPQTSLTCVHVAGTNGKGSVCAIVESVLRAAGFLTGLYTSPHLISFRERITIGGGEVAAELIRQCASELIPLADEMASGETGSPTYFEFLTALALLCFARAKVDYAVLETGLGGRLDATNVVAAPVVAITTIGLEHRAQLGDTVELIAAEKAAIIKGGEYAVCGELELEALAVVEKRCREKMATLMRIGSDILYRLLRQSAEGSTLSVHGACGCYGEISVSLAGRHQLANCAVALGLIEGLRRRGARIPPRAVAEGVASVRWPGRLEILCRSPLLLIDCAHNPQAAEAVANAAREIYRGRRWALILGILRDKDIGRICDALLPLASAVVTVRVPSERSASAEELASVCLSKGGRPVRVAVDPHDALMIARKMVVEGDVDGIFVTGSTYLVGAVMKLQCDEPQLFGPPTMKCPRE